ncbi:MAG: hypothetical protein ACT6S0_06280 [Roseateles sp.]|uniref:hypothetical protein n=1 Tax=Roseateles sp. TaxID=1971397 RepID=UPI0040362B6B
MIDYDWKAERLVGMVSFDDTCRPAAQAARSALEIQLLKEKQEREVVLLEALDEAGLRRTHARYFKSLEEMLAQAASA